jgi:hypothetical protein
MPDEKPNGFKPGMFGSGPPPLPDGYFGPPYFEIHDAGWAVIVFAAVLAALLGWVAFGHAHSFYEAACCSNADCAPISSQRVTEGSFGYAVDGKPIPQNIIRRAPDGQFHLCQPLMGQIRCLYAPDRGV